ncbi:MAG: hypothetical protein GY714_03460 [Desulfobacterales bacterium]|nr:hypothetical protein [Desulfobacterales bacterium]
MIYIEYFSKAIHPDFAMGDTLKSKIENGELGKKLVKDCLTGQTDGLI